VKIYIMTDMEGVAGVVSSVDYCYPQARYYEVGRTLTTLEVNAAIEGALEAGADDFLVADGHGWGAIDPVQLHPAAQLLTGRPLAYPFGCDGNFAAAFIVGQHAKANTDGGHLCHTGSFDTEEVTLNGHSLGELGINMLFIASFGVPTVLVAGDQACCDEAIGLAPGIVTSSVKEGWRHGAPAGLTGEEAERFNGSATHLHPSVARQRIKEAARLAVARRESIGRFWLDPPYEYLHTARRQPDGRPGARTRKTGADLIVMLNERGTVVAAGETAEPLAR
jgi:D-amino peptidase